MFARLVALFILVPMVELFLLLSVGARIGVIPTIAVIVITGFMGATLTRRQGLQTLAKYQEALSQGRMPHEELLEGLMILIAGAVLLTPGFLTDAVGFMLLVPAVRQSIRERLAQSIGQKFKSQQGGNFSGPTGNGPTSDKSDSPTLDIDAEVIDQDEQK